ncbi:thymidylate synthase [Microcoleus sp. Pol10D4]|uniref:thymidylate synthase n=1 Tax=Microcoleus sp. Pol10D4 TaxID=3055387 RepID=UPI002FD04AEA
MNNSDPLLIEETNLSRAWSRAFLHIINNPGKEISPLLVSLTGLTNGIAQEERGIREALDNSLIANNKQKVHTVANTIFPNSLWKRSKYDRNRLFEMYLNALPRYKALERHKNQRGIYFERLIAFGSGPENGNQLEYIISQYKSRQGVRTSMFQASIFDPARDHVSSAQIPFPCLQHVSFVPHKDKTLTVNAFYATQQIWEKAYGNYLGLCRLGDFMAHEMGLTLGRMNCFVGVAKLDTITKSHHSLTLLKNVARNALHPTNDQQTAERI